MLMSTGEDGLRWRSLLARRFSLMSCRVFSVRQKVRGLVCLRGATRFSGVSMASVTLEQRWSHSSVFVGGEVLKSGILWISCPLSSLNKSQLALARLRRNVR